MNFCSNCGTETTRRIPEGDNRLRDLCEECGSIHYQNPKIIAGCVVLKDQKVLLCKRAIEPKYGLWTLPAGFMENGETVAQAALRETWEEARSTPNLDRLYFVSSIPSISQVYMLYLAFMNEEKFESGPESLETKLFQIDDIPWDELAFHTVRDALKCLISDLEKGTFRLHCIDREEAPLTKVI
ncbi:NUDIX hydrolase [Litorivicinus sp.]|nr:NUDIX hydrolase [Litorivicinus sp.]